MSERAGDHVTYVGWQAIDRAEVAAGEPHGRPRIKFCSVDEMIEAARADGGRVRDRGRTKLRLKGSA